MGVGGSAQARDDSEIVHPVLKTNPRPTRKKGDELYELAEGIGQVGGHAEEGVSCACATRGGPLMGGSLSRRGEPEEM